MADLPYSWELEGSALGCCFLSETALGTVTSMLTAKDFYLPAHQVIFGVLEAMFREGKAVDLVTAKHALIAIGKLKEVAGVEYLMQITENVPSAVNAEHYANGVLAYSRQRTALEAAAELKKGAGSKEAVEKARRMLDEAVPVRARKGSDLMRLYEAVATRNPVVWSGMDALNRTTGGWYIGEFNVIGAKTGNGKSEMAIQAWMAACAAGTRACFLALELTESDIMSRVKRKVQNMAWAGVHDTTSASEKLLMMIEKFGVIMDDSANKADSIGLLSRAAGLVGPGGLVVVDHAQQMKIRSAGRDEFAQHQAAADQTQVLAKSAQVAVVVTSQVKVLETGEMATAGSMQWIKAAGLVVHIHKVAEDPDAPGKPIKNRRPARAGEKFVTLFEVVKNRHAGTSNPSQFADIIRFDTKTNCYAPEPPCPHFLDEIASRAALYDPFADPADALSIDPDTGEIME